MKIASHHIHECDDITHSVCSMAWSTSRYCMTTTHADTKHAQQNSQSHSHSHELCPFVWQSVFTNDPLCARVV